MEFEQNAPIFAANGDAVGHIDRVVVDPETKAITHIVVRKGFLLTEDKVVPINLIADATQERINLREDAGDLEALPTFEEKHYVRLDNGGASGPAVVSQPLPGMPGAYVSSAPRERFVKQVEQHIPQGTVALKEGAEVINSEGKHVGHVERIVTEAGADHATHLLVTHGLLSKERKLVPMAWVTIIGEDKVQLTVEPRLLDELNEYRNESDPDTSGSLD